VHQDHPDIRLDRPGIQAPLQSQAPRQRVHQALGSPPDGISFTLSQAAETKLEVRSISGRLMESRALGSLSAGEHALVLSRCAGTSLVRILPANGTTLEMVRPGI
jgi:hypothetical protein